MGRFFDYDGPLFKALEAFANLVVLNILTLLLCVPVITGGAAITALHFSVLAMVRGRESYVVKTYFRVFKENFKRGTLLWLPVLVVGAFAALDIYLIRTNPAVFPAPVRLLFGAGFLILSMIYVWVFPLLCHFEYEKTGAYIHNAALLAVGRLPRTLGMVAITLAPLIFIYMQPYKSVAWLFILGFSLPAWGKAWLYSPAFKALEPPEETGNEGDEAEDALEDIDEGMPANAGKGASPAERQQEE